MVVSNIIKARGIERRQEVVLEMSRKPLELPPAEEAKQADNPEVYSELRARNEELKGTINELREQLEELSTGSRRTEERMREL